VVAVPQWTEKLYPPAGGQDHLGLAGVAAGRILPKLSPGIIVQTVHPRYLSFYAFLLDEFWRRDLPRTPAAFSRFLRPREAIYAIGAHLCDQPEHDAGSPMQAIVGSGKAGAIARSDDESFDPGLDYVKNRLGGYGLYYASTLADFGLSQRSTPDAGLPFDAPTPRGREVAGAFRSAIEDTDYYQQHFDHDDAQVPRAAVEEYIRRACLCQLRTNLAPDRPLLRDAYLHAGGEEAAGERRATMRLLLDLADQTAGHKVDEDRFRQFIYYRSSSHDLTWTPREPVTRMARRWRLYQAREYYAYALNRMWRYLVEWGQSRIAVNGDFVAAASWWDHVSAELAVGRLAQALGVDDPGLDADSPIGDLADWAGTQAHVGGSLDDVWDRTARLTEHSVFDLARRSDAQAVIAASMTTLALVATRLGDPATAATFQDDWDICREGRVARLALDRFLRQWRQRAAAGTTLRTAARWLIDDYVIRQHERIAVAKLGQTGDTFRFRREGSAIRFYSQDAPANMSSSRFQALATTVHDLGFVDSLYSADATLTTDGRALLESGDLIGPSSLAGAPEEGSDGD
jgi:hypothetical protein